jgi:sugar/nucleoside kinase (ribokinase family)
VDVLASVPRAPAPDEKLELHALATQPGGQIATALVACARLGARVQYAGIFGDDANSALIRRALDEAGIDTTACHLAPCPNRSALILVDATAGTRTILWSRDQRLAWPASSPFAPLVARARILMVDATDLPAATEAAACARAAHVPVMLDIDHGSSGAERLLDLVDVMIVSQTFPEAHTGEPAMGRAMRSLHTRYQPALVVVTLGEDGAIAWDGVDETHVPGFDVPVVDPTGAGDAFRGGFAAAWAAAAPGTATLDQLLRVGNATAALNCRQVGAQRGLPTRAEIDAFLTEMPAIRSKQTGPAPKLK